MRPTDLGDNAALRLIEEGDAEELFQLSDRNREHLGKWFPWVERTKAAKDTAAFIEGSIKARENETGLDCVTLLDGKIVGVVGFHRWDHVRRTAEFGYWLGEEAEGKGIMTRAVDALCRYAFRKMKLNRVEIRSATHNDRSRRLALRLGFREEGRIKEAEVVHGEWFDDLIYGLLKREWEAR